jgi:hypothetical protein
MLGGILPIIPLLFFVVWLGLIVYVILLATRLVNAVEQIARSMTEHRARG